MTIELGEADEGAQLSVAAQKISSNDHQSGYLAMYRLQLCICEEWSHN